MAHFKDSFIIQMLSEVQKHLLSGTKKKASKKIKKKIFQFSSCAMYWKHESLKNTEVEH